MDRGASGVALWIARRMPGGLAGPVLLTFVIGWVTSVPAARAGEEVSAEAAAVLDKYVEVTGGKAAYAKIHNRVTKESVTHVGMGFDDSVVLYQEEPNKRYVTIESDALGPIENGTDGKVVWYLSDQTGPMIEGGTARTAELLAATFNAPVRWRELYSKAELAGEGIVEGRPCYKIVLTPEAGEPETRYYDKESNLLIKVEQTRLSSNFPPMPLEVTLGDYKPVDGLLIAHKRRQTMHQCGSEREMLFVTKSIEHNVEMPPNRFDPPKEIQAVSRKVASRSDSGGSGCCPGGGSVSGGASCGGGRSCGGGGGSCGGGSACGGGGSCGGSAASAGPSCGGASEVVPSAGIGQQPQGTGGCGGGS